MKEEIVGDCELREECKPEEKFIFVLGVLTFRPISLGENVQTYKGE
jgi:hypothetical protein